MSDVDEVRTLIAALPSAAQKRVGIVTDILRDLINQPGYQGHEIELAFTLVLAERVELADKTRTS